MFCRILIVFLFALPFASALAQSYPAASPFDMQSVDALGEDLFLPSGSTGMVLVVVRDDPGFCSADTVKPRPTPISFLPWIPCCGCAR